MMRRNYFATSTYKQTKLFKIVLVKKNEKECLIVAIPAGAKKTFGDNYKEKPALVGRPENRFLPRNNPERKPTWNSLRTILS